MGKSFSQYRTKALVDLQRRLNTIFTRKRDSGANVDCIYRNLCRVERELVARRAYW